MEKNDEILREFLAEAQEIFDQLDLDFVLLEKSPDDTKLLGSIFRAMHTLKGSSGFFSFRRLEKVAHAGESLLARVREGTLSIDQPMTSALLKTLDCLRDIVDGIKTDNQEPTGDDSALLDLLRRLTLGESVASAAPAEPAAPAASAVPLASPPLQPAAGGRLGRHPGRRRGQDHQP
ncbi:MAG: Hpt domain-containing protein, partial [Betaproteobacteria bacterium]